MIYNFVYRCTMCNKLIGGRYQVGIIRPFNVYIPCPNCYAIAKLQIDCGTDYESIEIKCLENSELIHNYEVDKEKMESVADYHIEISSEFPTKNSTDSTNKKDYTPWLRMADLIRKPETLTDDISLLQKERESSKSKITRIKQFTELYNLTVNNRVVDKSLNHA